MDWDNINALCEEGNNLALSGRYDKAMKCWQLAAEDSNDYEAKYRLGYYYFKGNEYIKQDMFCAIYWLSQAVKNGSYKAAKMLGEYYESLADVYEECEQIITSPLFGEEKIKTIERIAYPEYLEKAVMNYYRCIYNYANLIFKSSLDESTVMNVEEHLSEAKKIYSSDKSEELKITKLKKIFENMFSNRL